MPVSSYVKMEVGQALEEFLVHREMMIIQSKCLWDWPPTVFSI